MIALTCLPYICVPIMHRGDNAIQAHDPSGAVNFRDLGAQAALQAALGAIAGNNLAQFKAEFTVRVRHLEAIAASVIPLGSSQRQLGVVFSQLFDDIPLAMLMLQSAHPPGNRFGAQFGLTPAELALVNALARGQSVQAYAAARQFSVYTVRAQLKAVFAKTNLHRQGELLALFMRKN